MERYLIGTSLSMCLRDIIKGEVNEENVVLIVTGTKRDFESESTHYVAQDCPDLYKESEEVGCHLYMRRTHETTWTVRVAPCTWT
mgnify:CR=1 FL=1